MKKFISCLLMCAAFAGLYVPVNAAENAWKEYYVSVNGNDANVGTKEAPFKTIQAAKDAVRAVNRDMQGDIVVNIEEGSYYLDRVLDFSVEDSGYNGHRIIYRGIGDEKPVISGGKIVTGFKKSEYDGIYVADYDEEEAVLQLSVNGKRRFVAKAPNPIKGAVKPDKYDTDEWYDAHPNDISSDKYNYYNPDTEYSHDGMYLSKSDFGIYENVEDILFMWDRCWVTSMAPVQKIEQDPDRKDYLRITMEPGMWQAVVGNSNTQADPSRNFMAMNAFEMLDEPGEFYFNRKTKKLYYMPADDENMENAVVTVPVLETLVYIDGNDVDDKVKNITFDNLKFTDTEWNYSKGYSGNQGTSISGLNLDNEAPKAIYAERADGIEFINNVVYNIGGSAIQYYGGVTNSKITGNVFYDIGESAIVAGGLNHSDMALDSDKNLTPVDGVSDPVPEEFKDAAVDLLSIHKTKIDASFYDGNTRPINWPGYIATDWTNSSPEGRYANNVTWVDGEYTYSPTPWRDDYSKLYGEKPYVKFEFKRAYSIDEVTIAFDPENVTAVEKSDFEILVSNDKDFKEGTYKTFAVQNGEAASDVNHYTSEDNEKYRYVMIRKLSASDFALSRVWIQTKDRKPYVKHQRCSDIAIENNMIERTGVDVYRAVALFVTVVDNFKIKHNEIKDVPYSGISVGYTWNNDRISSRNIDCGYNYIYDCCQMLFDGGGIYVLGPQPDSHYYNNHIESNNIGTTGFYTDNGTMYETIENNYIEDTLYILSPYTRGTSGGIIQNVFRNNFGTHTVSRDESKDLNEFEEVKQTVIGQPPREAYDTYTNAGLEDEYKHLRDCVPEGRDNLYQKYDNYSLYTKYEGGTWKDLFHKNIIEELSYTREHAAFGTGLGMYPYEYRDKLDTVLNYVQNGKNSNVFIRELKARDFHKELKASLQRYSIDKTFELCRSLLEKAKNEEPGNYPEGAVSKFEKAIADCEKINIETPEVEYDVLTTLENAYNEMLSVRYTDVIANATVDGAVQTNINDHNNTVTIYVSDEEKLVTNTLSVETDGNSPVAAVIPAEVDLRKGVQIPVYNKAINQYRIWTIKGEVMQIESTNLINKEENWLQNTADNGLVKKGGEFTSLSGSRYPYMAQRSGAEGENLIEFAPSANSGSKSFSMILGANMSENFDYGNIDAVYNHVCIEFKDDEATLYKVTEGTRTVIDTAKTGIKWNEKNSLTYEIKNINNNSHFIVKLNGRLIFSEVIKKCSFGRFMGFYNPDAVIHVY